MFNELRWRLSQVYIYLLVPEIWSCQRTFRKYRFNIQKQCFLLFFIFQLFLCTFKTKKDSLFLGFTDPSILLYRTFLHIVSLVHKRFYFRRILIPFRSQNQLKVTYRIFGCHGSFDCDVCISMLNAWNGLLEFGIFLFYFDFLFDILPRFLCVFTSLIILLLLLGPVVLKNPIFFHENLQLGLINVQINFFISIFNIRVGLFAHHNVNIGYIRHLNASIFTPGKSGLAEILKYTHISHIIRVHTKLNMVFERQASSCLFESRVCNLNCIHFLIEGFYTGLLILVRNRSSFNLPQLLFYIIHNYFNFRLYNIESLFESWFFPSQSLSILFNVIKCPEFKALNYRSDTPLNNINIPSLSQEKYSSNFFLKASPGNQLICNLNLISKILRILKTPSNIF